MPNTKRAAAASSLPLPDAKRQKCESSLPIIFTIKDIFELILSFLSYSDLSALRHVSEELATKSSIIDIPLGTLQCISAKALTALGIRESDQILSLLHMNQRLITQTKTALYSEKFFQTDLYLVPFDDLFLLFYPKMDAQEAQCLQAPAFTLCSFPYFDPRYHALFKEGETFLSLCPTDNTLDRFRLSIETGGYTRERVDMTEMTIFTVHHTDGLSCHLHQNKIDQTLTLFSFNPITCLQEKHPLHCTPEQYSMLKPLLSITIMELHAVDSGLFLIKKNNDAFELLYLRKENLPQDTLPLIPDASGWKIVPRRRLLRNWKEGYFFTEKGVFRLSPSSTEEDPMQPAPARSLKIEKWNYKDENLVQYPHEFAKGPPLSNWTISIGHFIVTIAHTSQSLSAVFYNIIDDTIDEKPLPLIKDHSLESIISFTSEKSRLVLRTHEQIIVDDVATTLAVEHILILFPVFKTVTLLNGTYHQGYFATINSENGDSEIHIDSFLPSKE